MADEKKGPDEAKLLAEDPTLAHDILKPSEVLAARSNAEKKIEVERRKAAMSAIEKAHAEKLMIENGLTTGIEAKDEMVSVTVDLAEWCDRITISGKIYVHNQTYTVPRHVADTIREMAYRTHQHQFEIDGKSRTQFYQAKRETVLSPVGVKNAPAMAGA